jgi:hypothetical protein
MPQKEGFKFCLNTRNNGALPLHPACPDRLSVWSPAGLPTPAWHHENFKRKTWGFYVMQNPCVTPTLKRWLFRQCPHILLLFLELHTVGSYANSLGHPLVEFIWYRICSNVRRGATAGILGIEPGSPRRASPPTLSMWSTLQKYSWHPSSWLLTSFQPHP